MRHRSARLVHAHWDALRSPGTARRADLDPRVMRDALLDVMIVERDERGWRYALAGTRVSSANGRELKGKPFLDGWAPRPDGLDPTRAMEDGLCVRLECVGRGRFGGDFPFELCLFPVSHRDVAAGAAVGTMSPLPRADGTYWDGVPLEYLRVVAMETSYDFAEASSVPLPGRRPALVVHDGGRAAS